MPATNDTTTTNNNNNKNNDGSRTAIQEVSFSSKRMTEISQQAPKQDDAINTPTVTTCQEGSSLPPSSHDNSPLNQTLENVLMVLSRYDTINIKRFRPFQLIQDKVSKNEYSHPDAFKNDIDLLFTKVRSETKTHQQDDIERLYHSVITSIKLEVNRAHSTLMDTSFLDPNHQDNIRTALFRPTLDGFIFTDANTTITQLEEPLPSKVQAIAIHPTASENFTVPTLKQSVQQPYRFPSRYTKHEDKPIVPVQWLDYGAFTSFAPVCDSNNANTSYEWTYMGRAAKRHRRWERKQRRTLSQANLTQQKQQDDMDVDIDVDWLKDQGLDVDAILGSVATEDYDDNDAATLLGRNGELIKKLLSHQEKRFKIASSLSSSSDTQAVKVDEQEQETASKLQHQFHDILSQLPPSAVIQSQDIQVAMSRMPLKEATYRGTLPLNKIFAYPTSDRIDPSPPSFANITPTYSKDRWRLIDLQGHDNPTATTSTPLSSSPSTSQQHQSSPLKS